MRPARKLLRSVGPNVVRSVGYCSVILLLTADIDSFVFKKSGASKHSKHNYIIVIYYIVLT